MSATATEVVPENTRAIPNATRWLHLWALVTFCLAPLPLLLGAEVTTKGVGMVEPHPVLPPWHMIVLLAEGTLFDRGLGYVIEHAHRLAAFTLGCSVLVLALALWRREPRRWVRWLGFSALVCISAQGLVGIFRVALNTLMGGNLALIHGCFAHLVVALVASIALFTSQSWNQPVIGMPEETARLRRWARITVGLVFFQLALGALTRHRDLLWGARAHSLTAFAVVAAVVWLIKEVLENPHRSRPETVAVLLLAGLVVVQLFLGMEAWLCKFTSPLSLEKRALTPLSVQPDLMRSFHYFVGSLVFSATVVVALQAHRGMGWLSQGASARAERRLEGAT
jgi:cytochrome c oxidase assembly protein subunit 15